LHSHSSLSAADGIPAEAVFVDNDGNVGIGTTLPTELLHIQSSSDADVQVVLASDVNSPYIAFRRAKGAIGSESIVENSTVAGGIFAAGYDGALYRQVGKISFDVDGTPGSGDMPGRITFWTTPDGTVDYTEKMRITNNGSVGIGTTEPTTKLHVKGTVTAQNDVIVGQATETGDKKVWFVSEGVSGILTYRPADDSFVFSDPVSMPSANFTTGNVGIGKINPATALDVVGTVTATEFVGGGAGLTGIASSSHDHDGVYEPVLTKGNLSGTLPVSVTGGTGAVIGTGASISVADASDSARGIASFAANDFDVASGAVSLDYVNGQKATGLLNGFLSFGDWNTFNNKISSQWENGTGGIISYSGGNVGIGKTNPSQQLEITGSFSMPATTSATTGVIYLGGERFIHNYGTSNVFIGRNAGNYTTTGSGGNVVVGMQALKSNTTGYSNIAVGQEALFANTTGFWNVSVGSNALHDNTTGLANIAVGQGALADNTMGDSNSALGNQTMYRNTTGSNNTANGDYALYENTLGSYNSASGAYALYANTTGTSNTSIGYQGLYTNTAGYSNTASGARSLYLNTTGNYNVATGYQSLYSNTEGVSNVASGYNSLGNNTTGSYNTASGHDSLYYVATGSNNVAMGHSAGRYEEGSNSFYVDNQDRGSTAGDKAGALLYGKFDAVPANQTLTINGSVGIGMTNPGHKLDIAGGNGRVESGYSWLTSSDERYKKNITTLENSLDKIMNIRGVRYDLKDEENITVGKGRHVGFIAQELEKEFPEFVVIEENGYRAVAYDKMTAVLVEAVKDLKAQNDKLRRALCEVHPDSEVCHE
jgi:hypothetical protein